MKKIQWLNKIFGAVLSLSLLGLPLVALGATFISQETVAPADRLEDDLFGAGADVSINHEVTDDVFVAGNSVEITAPIGGDVFAAGRQVEISSTIGDDLMAAGSHIVLDGVSAEDVFVAGEYVEITDSTAVSGDVYAAGAQVTINGRVEGSVRISAERITIGNSAVIEGDLIVYGPEPALVAEEARIGGESKHVVAAVESPSMRDQILNWVRSVLTWFAITLVLLYLLPGLAQAVVQTTVEQSAIAVGVGALWLIIALPVAVLLLFTVILWPLGLLIATLLLATLLVALPYAALAVGAWLSQRLQGRATGRLSWQTALLGVVVLKLIALVPLLGWLVLLAAMVVSSGALLRVMWRRLRGEDSAPQPPVAIA